MTTNPRKCPCKNGGGGGGTKTCTATFTQEKTEPISGEPPPPEPPPPENFSALTGETGITDSPECVRTWTLSSEEGAITYEPPLKEHEGEPKRGEEKCEPEEALPPCVCGSSSCKDNPPKKTPDDPQWEGPTAETRSVKRSYKCKFKTAPHPDAPPGTTCGSMGTHGEDTFHDNVDLEFNVWTKTWTEENKTVCTCG
jgi:hypothetical protein